MDINVLKEKFATYWQNPKIRKGALIAILILAISFIAFNTDDVDTGGAGGEQAGQSKTSKRKVEANFFSQAGADNIEQGRMEEVYGLMEEQIAEREKSIDDREEEMRLMEMRVMKELEDLRFSQNNLRRDLDVQKIAANESAKEKQEKQKAATAVAKPSTTFTPASVNTPQQVPVDRGPMSQAADQVMPRTVDQKRIGIRTIDAEGDRFLNAQGVVTDLRVDQTELKTKKEKEEEAAAKKADREAKKAADKAAKEAEGQEIFLPAGSMISGILITGMDVPTGSSVKSDPFPSILRIKQEALLPNNFSADIRECVIVASALGDLATSRAYLRAEAISCVTDEGKAVEANLNAFAVGPDGRNGVLGRLVSKNGEAAMKSAWAGFLSGVANLAGTATYNIGDNETGVFSALQTPDMMQSMAGTAALQGAGDALERLAEYYIEIAEQMKPYLEINPGVEIQFIIQKGTSIRIN